MIIARSSVLRAMASPARSFRPRSTRFSASTQRYASSGVPKASSSVPWAATAAVATAVGLWIVLSPTGGSSAHHIDEHPTEEGKKKQKDESDDKEEEPYTDPDSLSGKLGAKKNALEADLTLAKARGPKSERSGDSVKNHSIAAEKNEHKVRTGKFSKEEFDNHITSFSDDPSKDFEKIKKKVEDKKDEIKEVGKQLGTAKKEGK